jgi:hypothetical protein
MYIVLIYENRIISQVPVVHTCNLSYSEGRDQEDHGSKPASGKQFRKPYLEKTHHKKRAGRKNTRLVSMRPCIQNPALSKKKKKKKKNENC